MTIVSARGVRRLTRQTPIADVAHSYTLAPRSTHHRSSAPRIAPFSANAHDAIQLKALRALSCDRPMPLFPTKSYRHCESALNIFE